MVTLPLESTITIAKDGSSVTEHTAFATGEAGQALAEAFVELHGGTMEELIRFADELHAKEGSAAL
jgi:hypothetical protein